MPAKFGAGQMIELVAFDQRKDEEDEYGNVISTWVEQFQQHAKFIYLRGSETVMAARLESQEAMVMQVRRCADTLRIGSAWQARDVRRGTAYNIQAVEEDRSRALIDLLVEGGVATG
jgi:SPP1 family predicted phage head-tail adaptor